MGQEPQNTTGQREEEKIKGELKQAAEAQEVRGCIDAPFEPSTHDLKDSNSKEGRFRAWADRLFAKRRSTAVATQRTDTPKAEASQGVEVETEPAKPSEPSTDTKTESKTSISEKKPIFCVCKHCNTPFVNGGLGPDYNCGGYHLGDLISKTELLCRYHGQGAMDLRELNKIPDPVWSCCLKEKFWASCLHQNKPHEAR